MKTKTLSAATPTLPRPVVPPLAERDRLALKFIQSYWDDPQRGYAPTVRQIAAALRSQSTSIAKHRVLSLEKRGLLHVPREDGAMVSHTMRLTTLGRAALDTYTDSLRCERTP